MKCPGCCPIAAWRFFCLGSLSAFSGSPLAARLVPRRHSRHLKSNEFLRHWTSRRRSVLARSLHKSNRSTSRKSPPSRLGRRCKRTTRFWFLVQAVVQTNLYLGGRAHVLLLLARA